MVKNKILEHPKVIIAIEKYTELNLKTKKFMADAPDMKLKALEKIKEARLKIQKI